ncbi:hypothetical protein [Burkholderia pyrrocinia]
MASDEAERARAVDLAMHTRRTPPGFGARLPVAPGLEQRERIPLSGPWWKRLVILGAQASSLGHQFAQTPKYYSGMASQEGGSGGSTSPDTADQNTRHPTDTDPSAATRPDASHGNVTSQSTTPGKASQLPWYQHLLSGERLYALVKNSVGGSAFLPGASAGPIPHAPAEARGGGLATKIFPAEVNEKTAKASKEFSLNDGDLAGSGSARIPQPEVFKRRLVNNFGIDPDRILVVLPVDADNEAVMQVYWRESLGEGLRGKPILEYIALDGESIPDAMISDLENYRGAIDADFATESSQLPYQNPVMGVPSVWTEKYRDSNTHDNAVTPSIAAQATQKVTQPVTRKYNIPLNKQELIIRFTTVANFMRNELAKTGRNLMAIDLALAEIAAILKKYPYLTGIYNDTDSRNFVSTLNDYALTRSQNAKDVKAYFLDPVKRIEALFAVAEDRKYRGTEILLHLVSYCGEDLKEGRVTTAAYAKHGEDLPALFATSENSTDMRDLSMLLLQRELPEAAPDGLHFSDSDREFNAMINRLLTDSRDDLEKAADQYYDISTVAGKLLFADTQTLAAYVDRVRVAVLNIAPNYRENERIKNARETLRVALPDAKKRLELMDYCLRHPESCEKNHLRHLIKSSILDLLVDKRLAISLAMSSDDKFRELREKVHEMYSKQEDDIRTLLDEWFSLQPDPEADFRNKIAYDFNELDKLAGSTINDKDYLSSANKVMRDAFDKHFVCKLPERRQEPVKTWLERNGGQILYENVKDRKRPTTVELLLKLNAALNNWTAWHAAGSALRDEMAGMTGLGEFIRMFIASHTDDPAVRKYLQEPEGEPIRQFGRISYIAGTAGRFLVGEALMPGSDAYDLYLQELDMLVEYFEDSGSSGSEGIPDQYATLLRERHASLSKPGNEGYLEEAEMLDELTSSLTSQESTTTVRPAATATRQKIEPIKRDEDWHVWFNPIEQSVMDFVDKWVVTEWSKAGMTRDWRGERVWIRFTRHEGPGGVILPHERPRESAMFTLNDIAMQRHKKAEKKENWTLVHIDWPEDYPETLKSALDEGKLWEDFRRIFNNFKNSDEAKSLANLLSSYAKGIVAQHGVYKGNYSNEFESRVRRVLYFCTKGGGRGIGKHKAGNAYISGVFELDGYLYSMATGKIFYKPAQNELKDFIWLTDILVAGMSVNERDALPDDPLSKACGVKLHKSYPSVHYDEFPGGTFGKAMLELSLEKFFNDMDRWVYSPGEQRADEIANVLELAIMLAGAPIAFATGPLAGLGMALVGMIPDAIRMQTADTTAEYKNALDSLILGLVIDAVGEVVPPLIKNGISRLFSNAKRVIKLEDLKGISQTVAQKIRGKTSLSEAEWDTLRRTLELKLQGGGRHKNYAVPINTAPMTRDLDSGVLIASDGKRYISLDDKVFEVEKLLAGREWKIIDPNPANDRTRFGPAVERVDGNWRIKPHEGLLGGTREHASIHSDLGAAGPSNQMPVPPPPPPPPLPPQAVAIGKRPVQVSKMGGMPQPEAHFGPKQPSAPTGVSKERVAELDAFVDEAINRNSDSITNKEFTSIERGYAQKKLGYVKDKNVWMDNLEKGKKKYGEFYGKAGDAVSKEAEYKARYIAVECKVGEAPYINEQGKVRNPDATVTGLSVVDHNDVFYRFRVSEDGQVLVVDNMYANLDRNAGGVPLRMNEIQGEFIKANGKLFSNIKYVTQESIANENTQSLVKAIFGANGVRLSRDTPRILRPDGESGEAFRAMLNAPNVQPTARMLSTYPQIGRQIVEMRIQGNTRITLVLGSRTDH